MVWFNNVELIFIHVSCTKSHHGLWIRFYIFDKIHTPIRLHLTIPRRVNGQV